MGKRLIYEPKAPLIFVPGLFGSMSHVILPGTGNWSFGMAAAVYEPFVLLLESMGYRRNVTLFIAFYDWRQRIPVSAQTYLVQAIGEAKRKTGASRVNLVCHSMGGLVARAYVQSPHYQDDVEQLIILCSPNAGSPANYSYWTGAELLKGPATKANIVSQYMNVYLSYLRRVYPTHTMEAIHTHFPSLLDLVPCKDYGDYLIVETKDSMRFVPYNIMQVKNTFLDELNNHRDILKSRNIEVTLIAGIDQSTIQYLQSARSDPTTLGDNANLWYTVNSQAGDGNVMVHSVFLLDGDKHMVKGTHIEVLYRSDSILRNKLS